MESILPPDSPEGLSELERVSLCETLDRVLNKGVVVVGRGLHLGRRNRPDLYRA